MAMNETMGKANTATTSAGNNTLKAAAVTKGAVDAVVAAICRSGTLNPAQQQAVTAFKAYIDANAAATRIAIYGS
jgi:hypothetical protein